MKLFKDSLIYVYRNWWYLLILALPASAFAGLLYSPFKSIKFIGNLKNFTVKNFGDIFNSLFDFSFKGIMFFILAFVFICITVSIALGFIENNMRSGKKDYKDVLRYFNNNIIIVAFNLGIFSLILFIIKFLLSALLFLIVVIFTGLNNVVNIGTIIVSILLITGVLILVLQIFSIFLINVPNMIINGFNFKDALYNSIKLVNKSNSKLLVAAIIPFSLVLLLVVLTNGYFLVNLILTIVLFMYYTALSMIAYFDLSDTTRYDNRKYYINY